MFTVTAVNTACLLGMPLYDPLMPMYDLSLLMLMYDPLTRMIDLNEHLLEPTHYM